MIQEEQELQLEEAMKRELEAAGLEDLVSCPKCQTTAELPQARRVQPLQLWLRTRPTSLRRRPTRVSGAKTRGAGRAARR